MTDSRTPWHRAIAKASTLGALLFAGACHPQPLVAAAPVCPAAKGNHWGYEGDSSPEHWGDLDANYRLCKTGEAQSPVDISGVVPDKTLTPLQLVNVPGPATLQNNGHTLQIKVAGSTLTLAGVRYRLEQFHFHSPSDHTIGGSHADMEAHLVYRTGKCSLAVVSVLFNVGTGPGNPLIDRLWRAIPQGTQSAHDAVALPEPVNPGDLFPELLGYWTMVGSLTTPPCSEGVPWYILKTPVDVSQEQVDRFRAVIGPSTARPIQPLGARTIRASQFDESPASAAH